MTYRCTKSGSSGQRYRVSKSTNQVYARFCGVPGVPIKLGSDTEFRITRIKSSRTSGETLHRTVGWIDGIPVGEGVGWIVVGVSVVGEGVGAEDGEAVGIEVPSVGANVSGVIVLGSSVGLGVGGSMGIILVGLEVGRGRRVGLVVGAGLGFRVGLFVLVGDFVGILMSLLASMFIKYS